MAESASRPPASASPIGRDDLGERVARRSIRLAPLCAAPRREFSRIDDDARACDWRNKLSRLARHPIVECQGETRRIKRSVLRIVSAGEPGDCGAPHRRPCVRSHATYGRLLSEKGRPPPTSACPEQPSRPLQSRLQIQRPSGATDRAARLRQRNYRRRDEQSDRLRLTSIPYGTAPTGLHVPLGS